MMKPSLVKRFVITAAAVLLLGAPLSHAVIYKWTEPNGTITYSSTPPPDLSKVKNFIAIEDNGAAAAEKRRDSAVAKPDTAPKTEASTPKGEAATVKPDPALRPESPRLAIPDTPRPDTARRDSETVTPDPPPRAASRPGRPEAVQDPCLRSADPQCYQRHKDKYHPYYGYAPSITTGAAGTSASSAPVGATSSGGAGGAVGGQIRITPTPPAKAVQPLPGPNAGGR